VQLVRQRGEVVSKAFRCDRCQRYEDDEPVAGVTLLVPTEASAVSGSSQRKTEATELCSVCFVSLRDWRDYYKTNPKPEFGKKAAGQ
jgi:hypothetical protein